MSDNDEQQNGNDVEKLKRQERLVGEAREPTRLNKEYSSFIRRARLILPVIALIIAAIIFTWSNIDDRQIVPVIETPTITKEKIGKNELLNPKFESRDRKEQPFTITAKRAIQGEKDEELIILEDPIADMLLDSGNWIAMTADQGAYKQDNQNILMRGNVRLFHDEDYQMVTEKLHMNMEESTAFSDTDVYAQGPAGTLNAKGLEANSEKGHLSFTGPAKLVLYQKGKDKSLGGLLP